MMCPGSMGSFTVEVTFQEGQEGMCLPDPERRKGISGWFRGTGGLVSSST